MKHLPQIIKLDVKAAIRAFKADDFDSMNTFANRAMANAILGKNKKLILPGFFMKEVATTYSIVKVHRASALSTAKVVGNKHLKLLEEMLDENVGTKDFWLFFYKLNLELKDLLKDDFEKDAYSSEDPEFSHAAFKWLLDYLKERKKILLNPRNALLRGTINEMDRIFKVHGGYESEVYAISLLKALSRYYDYFRYAYESNGTIDEEKATSTILPFVDKIASIVSSKRVNLSEMTNVFWELVSGWRKFFIEYMELYRHGMAVEKAIQLPEEAKRKLAESITKTLEREVKVK